MISLKIKTEDGGRELCVRAKNMKELIDVQLPKWLPIYEKEKNMFKNNKNYILDPKSFLKKEEESGWYYDL